MVSLSQVHLWFIGGFVDKLVGLVTVSTDCLRMYCYLLVTVIKCLDLQKSLFWLPGPEG